MNEEMKEKVQKIHARIYHNYINRWNDKRYSSWHFVSTKILKGTIDDKIMELLNNGYRVTGGYYATSVRGYHDYYLMYKDGEKL